MVDQHRCGAKQQAHQHQQSLAAAARGTTTAKHRGGGQRGGQEGGGVCCQHRLAQQALAGSRLVAAGGHQLHRLGLKCVHILPAYPALSGGEGPEGGANGGQGKLLLALGQAPNQGALGARSTVVTYPLGGPCRRTCACTHLPTAIHTHPPGSPTVAGSPGPSSSGRWRWSCGTCGEAGLKLGSGMQQ